MKPLKEALFSRKNISKAYKTFYIGKTLSDFVDNEYIKNKDSVCNINKALILVTSSFYDKPYIFLFIEFEDIDSIDELNKIFKKNSEWTIPAIYMRSKFKNDKKSIIQFGNYGSTAVHKIKAESNKYLNILDMEEIESTNKDILYKSIVENINQLGEKYNLI